MHSCTRVLALPVGSVVLVLYMPVEGAVVVEDPGAQRTVEQGPGPEHHRYWFIWQNKQLFLFVIRIVHFLLFMYQ